jgi:hypothetical protein
MGVPLQRLQKVICAVGAAGVRVERSRQQHSGISEESLHFNVI